MRRSYFLSTSAALVAGATTTAAATPGGPNLVERAAQFDRPSFDAVVGRPAQMRQLIEAIGFNPSLWNTVKNAFNGFQFGYGHAPNGITIAVAGHGASTAYSYSDYVWQKYRVGEFLKINDSDGKPVSANLWLKAKATYELSADPDDENGMYQDTSIQMLQRRGLVMLTCHTSVEEQSRALVKRGFAPAGMEAPDVAEDILTHLIDGTLLNPSMIATVAVLQKTHGYTYAALTY